MEIRKFKTEKFISKNESLNNPSEGVFTPIKLSEQVIDILTERIKDEYLAHYFYRSAANWCKNVNYKKAAEFFENEASSELDHAKKLQEYMDDWNVKPVIKKTETNFEFENLIDIINNAYQMELGLLKSYNQSSSQIFTNDLTTFDFLQEFRELQKSAVIEYSDLLNALLLVDYNDKFQLLYFEQTYF